MSFEPAVRVQSVSKTFALPRHRAWTIKERMRHPIAALLLTLASLAPAAGCAGDRPFVLTSAAKLRDLYWRGELTDAGRAHVDGAVEPSAVSTIGRSRPQSLG